MTVIKKAPQHYSFQTNSGNNSDTESLHLGNGTSAATSDAESLHNEPVRRPVRLFVNTPEYHVSLKRNSGRKKIRRHQNKCLLHTLAEEDENESTLVEIMETYKSPFAKLLEDDDALSFWNIFTEKSEEEQTKIIGAFNENNKSRNYNNNHSLRLNYPRISSRIKHTIKLRKNLSLEQVQESENELIEFFQKTPSDIYIRWPPTYFERLLLHAIAQYHGLKSLGCIENGVKKVQIYNTLTNWGPADCFLTDFVADLRKHAS